MGLNLISPVGNNFIKDWPAQNINNTDSIDAYAGKALLGSQVIPYTPQLQANGSNPNLGVGGINQGFYYQIWDWIYAWGEFRFGTSGFSLGSGTYFVSLPFTADTSIVGNNITAATGAIVGNGILFDASTDGGKRPLICQLRTTTDIEFMRPNGDTGSEFVNSGSPVTWTNGDGVSWTAQYRRLTT